MTLALSMPKTMPAVRPCNAGPLLAVGFLFLLAACGPGSQEPQLTPAANIGKDKTAGSDIKSGTPQGADATGTAAKGAGTPTNSALGSGTLHSANQQSSATSGQASPPSSVAAADCVEGDAFTCAAELALVKYTNAIRAKVGKGPLQQDFKLSYVARDWSVKQGAMISHTGFPLARVTVFQQKFPGVAVPSISAENVAFNGGGGTDPDAAAKTLADQWEGSPGHYANIISDHTWIGVGISCPGAKSSAGGGTTDPSSSQDSSGLGSLISSLFSGGGGGCTGTQIFAN